MSDSDIPEGVTVEQIDEHFEPILGDEPYLVITVSPGGENVRLGGFDVNDPQMLGQMSAVLLHVGTQIRGMSRDLRKQAAIDRKARK